MAACNAGFRTKFWRTAVLVNALTEAKHQGYLSRFMRQFEKLDLLICDEWLNAKAFWEKAPYSVAS